MDVDPRVWRDLPLLLVRRILYQYGGLQHPTSKIFLRYMSKIHSKFRYMQLSVTLSRENFLQEFLTKQCQLIKTGTKIFKNQQFVKAQIKKYNADKQCSHRFLCAAECSICTLPHSLVNKTSLRRRGYLSLFKIYIKE